jgi:hypothetical protein
MQVSRSACRVWYKADVSRGEISHVEPEQHLYLASDLTGQNVGRAFCLRLRGYLDGLTLMFPHYCTRVVVGTLSSFH